MSPPSPQPVLLVGVSLPSIPVWEAEDSLDELSRLAHTATLREGARLLQSRERIDPTYYIGKGKAGELKPAAEDCGAGLIVFDNDLSPAQMRNLEKLTGLRILDRSGLILDIFALHARTHTAQLQVELAQLNYLLPRLTRQWSHLSRQAGGGAIRGMGAAGVRGPGETQLETDRRLIRRRVNELNLKLERISGQLATSRKNRREQFKVALVGYTNAGKSTLMRALSGAQVLVADQLFATLDSTTRAVQLEQGRKILLTDTVGFIRRLPHHLFASFHATLEEALQADLLLHVVDMSHPHYEKQQETVAEVLRELGLEDKPTLLVYNKIDRIDPGEQERLAHHYAQQAGAVAVSALGGVGLRMLREKILYYSQEEEVTVDLQIPQQEGRLLSQLHHQGEVLTQAFADDQVHLRVRLDRSWVRRWRLERFAPG
ncbi:MAG: GTPase HflX [Candidatus Latescibacteria bacterium]|nr:GTPase HflX [Candidatus Latescibacterota bacterium]